MPIKLRVVRLPGETEKACVACSQCCTYIAINVPIPDNVGNASDLLWMSYHRVNLATDERGEDWWVYVPHQCSQLQADGRCGTYPTRPITCREYSPKECEVNLLPIQRLWQMETPVAFLRALRKLRPKIYRRLVGKRYVPHALIAEAEASDDAPAT